MSFIKTIYTTILDALFPVSKAEQEVLALDPSQAYSILPRAKKSPIMESCSLFSYKDDRVWRLIWCVKYKKSLVAAKIAGSALSRVLQLFSLAADPIILVPMPITTRRRRERGFNQCELIISEIEKMQSGIDGDRTNRCVVIRDLLLRTRHRSRQTLKDREERLESAQNIFAINVKSADHLHDLYNIRRAQMTDHTSSASSVGKVEAMQIDKAETQQTTDRKYLLIVIDDVVTTGSTIRDAVYTLRNAGFEKTFGLSVAH